MRIPGAPVAFRAWVGSGFLVPLLPYGVLSTPPGSGGGSDGGPVRPAWGILVSAAAGTVRLYWAAGGTLGIARPAERTTDGYVLGAVCGFRALDASVAVHHIRRDRPSGQPHRLALVSGWVGSGSLFAWSGWKLPFTLYAAASHPSGFAPPGVKKASAPPAPRSSP